MDFEIKTLDEKINLKNIRNFIIDNSVTDDKIILLNQKNFDEISLEHLNYYKENIKVPFKFVGTEINEDLFGKVPLNKIGVFSRLDYEKFYYYDGNESEILFSYYRCPNCGEFVSENGENLTFNEMEKLQKELIYFSNKREYYKYCNHCR